MHQLQYEEDLATELADKKQIRNTLYFISSTEEYLEPIVVTAVINGKSLPMELDTGASRFIISYKIYKCLWPKESPPLKSTSAYLQTYTGEEMVIKI